MENKRGISSLIATVLMILITISMTMVIYNATRSYMNPEQSLKCNELNLEIKNDWTCYDRTRNETQVSIMRGEQDIQLSSLQVQIFGNGKATTTKISEGSAVNGVWEYASTTANMTLPKISEVRTYVFNNSIIGIKDPETVSVAPVIRIGKTDKVCKTAAEAAIKDC